MPGFCPSCFQSPDELYPISLSVRAGRLLATDEQQGRLTMYDKRGRLQQAIVLQQDSRQDAEQKGRDETDGGGVLSNSHWVPFHAAETAHSTVIVCYRSSGDQVDRIAELDMLGKLLRSFDCAADPASGPGLDPPTLDWPMEVGIDVEGRAFISDRNNQRALVLNPHLGLERVLELGGQTDDVDPAAKGLLKQMGGPRQVRLGPKNGQLIACMTGGVAVFEAC